ncbi:hypothetical protein CLU79DRAFT_732175 [Phycomyces nitens]|nr:hypothetical protein CLU79DRAFT_732175 [Phycomyces nitens]
MFSNMRSGWVIKTICPLGCSLWSHYYYYCQFVAFKAFLTISLSLFLHCFDAQDYR